MLNYIWFGLLAVGILAAIGYDVYDEAANPYRNGIPVNAKIELHGAPAGTSSSIEGFVILSPAGFNSIYPQNTVSAEVRQPVTILISPSGQQMFALPVTESSPSIWKEMAKGAAAKDRLTGKILSFEKTGDGSTADVRLEFEPIHFVKMKAVTQAALDIAGVAVTLAFGLIGIMALWLGVMKIADEAGMLTIVTRFLTPVTRRLFPDVPAGHPAIGAIVMNMAANMLGLNNAATPMGLKAMDELNKLNTKPGTVTNAMVTFLAINTGGLVLLPATAMAVRASVGSSNPGIIIGTSIVGAGCATIAGVVAAKLLQRLPMFNRESPSANRPERGQDNG